MNITTNQKIIAHPLEDVFDIESSSTMVEFTEITPAVVVEMPNYDAKDTEIEDKLEEIYTIAMGQASNIGDEIERVEGKFKARLGEVTATMLTVALGAVREKTALKMHKDKLTPSPGGGTHTTNNNLILADRNEILRALLDKKK